MKVIKSKDFKREKFDVAIISFPSSSNMTNFLLASVINSIKPKLSARLVFDELPITIINNGHITAPSIDFYFKKIKNKKYAFVIGNYKPKEKEAYMKIYDLIKHGKEILILNEFNRKEGDLFYMRKEGTKVKDKRIEAVIKKLKPIDNVIIKGMPPTLFELAQREKKNLTMLFFNLSAVDSGIKLLEEIVDFPLSIEMNKAEANKAKEEKENHERKKFTYIG
jgi:hypothetical protein